MPVKESIAGNKVTEQMLVPHLRKRFAGKSIFQILSNESQILTGICGEPIQYGQAVYLEADGKLYVANALANKPAFAFSGDTGEVNQKIPLKTDGILDINTIGQTGIGNYVFLRSNGNVGTIENINPGNIVQIAGLKISENQIKIYILEPEKIE